MTKHILARVAQVAALSALAIGCQGRDNETAYVAPAPMPIAPKTDMPAAEAPIGGGPVATDDNTPITFSIEGATDRLAEAHCQSALACNQVGTGKKAGDWAKCVNDGRSTAAKGLSYESCPKGVDGTKLMECIDAIHGGECTNIMSSIDAIAPCANATLCAK